jgi:hypothetical protein
MTPYEVQPNDLARIVALLDKELALADELANQESNQSATPSNVQRPEVLRSSAAMFASFYPMMVKVKQKLIRTSGAVRVGRFGMMPHGIILSSNNSNNFALLWGEYALPSNGTRNILAMQMREQDFPDEYSMIKAIHDERSSEEYKAAERAFLETLRIANGGKK